jgi:hypothetical protein
MEEELKGMRLQNSQQDAVLSRQAAELEELRPLTCVIARLLPPSKALLI